MKIVKLECPSCGGNITDSIPEGMKYMFCKYCGQKMFIDDGVKRSEHREIKEDITELRRIESEKEIELKRLEMLEKDDKRSTRLFAGILITCLTLIVGSIAALYIDDAVKDHHIAQMEQQGMISAGSYQDYEGKDVTAVVAQLRDRGFTDINSYDLNDAGWWWDKADTVASITIDGKSTFYSSDYFNPDVPVRITFH